MAEVKQVANVWTALANAIVPRSRSVAANLARQSETQFSTSLTGSTYDAVKSKNKRSAPTGVLRSEDAELLPSDRKKLISAARDLHRNFSLAAWMIRRHLDYVSTFSFQCRSGNPAVDEQVERLMRWWMYPANCDVTGRFSFSKLIRLAEMRRVVDGDVFLLKLSDGRIQAVEGDRVRTPVGGMPEGLSAADLLHGVQTNNAGKPIRFCVCKRQPVNDSSGGSPQFTFERMVKASNAYHFGYFDRFDQVRGISPLAAAVNTLRDVYEAGDYALAKMKVAQLFGLVFFRESDDSTVPVEEVADEDDDSGNRYKANPAQGPMVLDLDPGDKAEFLESKTPSTEFQAFSQTMIGVALKALDIPYSFYAENFTNYSGARQALLQYELSAKIKRMEVQAMIDHLTAWRIGLWIQDGVLDANLRELQWEWIPQGVGWIDPLKEINANIAAIHAGLDTRTNILRQRQGKDFYEVADELKRETDYLMELGLPVDLPPVAGQPLEVTNAE